MKKVKNRYNSIMLNVGDKIYNNQLNSKEISLIFEDGSSIIWENDPSIDWRLVYFKNNNIPGNWKLFKKNPYSNIVSRLELEGRLIAKYMREYISQDAIYVANKNEILKVIKVY